MAFCPLCGNQLEEGQICNCTEPANSTASETKSFFARVKAWPTLTKRLFAVISILVVLVVLLSAIIPSIANAVASSQVNSIIKKSEDASKKIINAALNGKSFDSLNLACTDSRSNLNKITDEYYYLLATFEEKDDGYWYKEINKIDATGRSSVSKIDIERSFTCTVDIEFDYIMVDYDYRTGEQEDVSGFNETSMQFIYVYESGKWVIQSISMGNW